jgi:hypothetical protein
MVGLSLLLFRGRVCPDGGRAVAEWCIVFLVAALFGPVTWKSYLVVFLLPTALFFKAWRSPDTDPHDRRWIGRVLFFSFLLGGPLSPDIVGRDLAGRYEMASCITLAGFILLGGLFWLLSGADHRGGLKHHGHAEPSKDKEERSAENQILKKERS